MELHYVKKYFSFSFHFRHLISNIFHLPVTVFKGLYYFLTDLEALHGLVRCDQFESGLFQRKRQRFFLQAETKGISLYINNLKSPIDD